MIDIASLIVAGVAPTQARVFAPALREACYQYAINTPARVSAFLGQAMYESSNFVALEENLWYTTPERIRQIFSSRVPSMEEASKLVRNPQALANRVYAGILGNRDESSGDGWAYRGRGIFQITGRLRYDEAAVDLGLPLIERPEMVGTPEVAVVTAAAYWSTNNLNALADAGDIDGITLAINGRAKSGLKTRVALTQQCAEAFA